MLRNDWTEAWEDPENPKPLGMPLQFMVTMEAVSRASQYADKAQDIAFNPVGQIVGHMEKVRPVKDVIYTLVEETIAATERLERTLGQTAG
jgi:NAD(P)H-dependent flavin oxidoreductase YrpB (nitropropane dioxygenase family)